MRATLRWLVCCSSTLTGLALLPAPAQAGPGKPCNVQANPDGTDQIRLTWDDSADNETGFRVDGRVGSSGSFIKLGDGPANSIGAVVIGLDPGTKYEFRVRSFNNASVSPYSDVVAAFSDAFTASSSFCAPGNGICLNNRFRVQGTWRTATGSGNAVGDQLAADSGAFYFFSPSNLELLVKVLNGCGLNDRYWVFFGATTNVEYTLTVTDTQTGTVRRYFNPLNRPAPPVLDTSAFATCP